MNFKDTNWNPSTFKDPLTAEEERRCFELMHAGDEEARAKLIEHNMKLVLLSLKYIKYDTENDRDDMISCGMIGLIKAVDNFSLEKGTRFATFAMKYIRGTMIKMWLKNKAKHACNVSLDGLTKDDENEDGDSFHEFVDSGFDLEKYIETKSEIERVKTAINTVLSENRRNVITLRFGFDRGGDRRTQDEVATILGITKTRVCQIEKEALMVLREVMEGDMV